jgi:hypothetical protein
MFDNNGSMLTSYSWEYFMENKRTFMAHHYPIRFDATLEERPTPRV